MNIHMKGIYTRKDILTERHTQSIYGRTSTQNGTYTEGHTHEGEKHVTVRSK